MNTYAKIEKLRLSAGLSINKLEKECGLSRQTIEKWTTSIPRSDAIAKIAKYFNVTTDYLLGLTEESSVTPLGLNADESELIAVYRQLDPQNKTTIQALAKAAINATIKK